MVKKIGLCAVHKELYYFLLGNVVFIACVSVGLAMFLFGGL